MLRRVPWASWLAPFLPLESHPWKEWPSDRDKDALASGLVLECCFWDRRLQGIPIGVRAFEQSQLGFKWLGQQWAWLTCPEQGWPPGGATSLGMQTGSLRLDLSRCQQGRGQRRWVRLRTPLPLTLLHGAVPGLGGKPSEARAVQSGTAHPPTPPGVAPSYGTARPVYHCTRGWRAAIFLGCQHWEMGIVRCTV